MAVSENVDLAHEPSFDLGRLSISPSRRQLVRDDGEREVLEHRIMQVLIVLARARGAIVSRDDLIKSCWNGRAVCDNSIHRVIYRLRRLAEGFGLGSFRIETVTKVGYRLTSDGVAPSELCAAPEAAAGAYLATGATRRSLVLGAVAAASLAGASTLLYRRLERHPVPPEAKWLMASARPLRNQNTFEGLNQAIGLFRRVVEIAPDYADGWGLLGVAYAIRSHYILRAEGEFLRERAEAAGRRALGLDRGNAYGELALGMALPFIGPWMKRERHFIRALADRPDDDDVLAFRALTLQSVGRSVESMRLYERIRQGPFTPVFYLSYIRALWNSGRIEEAELALDDAAALYPTKGDIWYMHFSMLLYGGRPAEAIAFVQNADGRPTEMSEDEQAGLIATARALQGRDAGQVDAVIRARLEQARETGFRAVTAIRNASAFGRLDEAFAVAEAYYFGRGFTVRDFPTPESVASIDQRRTDMLFEPVTRPMRTDRRFNRMVDELGLERYWRETGIQPDYRLA